MSNRRLFFLRRNREATTHNILRKRSREGGKRPNTNQNQEGPERAPFPTALSYCILFDRDELWVVPRIAVSLVGLKERSMEQRRKQKTVRTLRMTIDIHIAVLCLIIMRAEPMLVCE